MLLPIAQLTGTVAMAGAETMPRAARTMDFVETLQCDGAVRLANDSGATRLVRSAQEPHGVCKRISRVPGQAFGLTRPSDLLCPLLQKVFGDQLNCASPEVGNTFPLPSRGSPEER